MTNPLLKPNWLKLILNVGFLSLASLILFISILKSAAVKYNFNTRVINGTYPFEKVDIAYGLVYPGPILPDHFLWPVKVLRDKVWLFLTPNSEKKMELYLLLADKRLGAARVLMANQKYELAVATLVRSQEYLRLSGQKEESVRSNGGDTQHFVYRFLLATLKHREVIRAMANAVPDDVRNQLVVIENNPREMYKTKIHLLGTSQSSDIVIPYNWE